MILFILLVSCVVYAFSNDFLMRDCYLLVEEIRNIHIFQEDICKQRLTGIWNITSVDETLRQSERRCSFRNGRKYADRLKTSLEDELMKKCIFVE